MERKDLEENFRFYPPSGGVGIPPFLTENSRNNEVSPPPSLQSSLPSQYRLGSVPPFFNSQMLVDHQSRPEILNIYWEGGLIEEAIRSSHHPRQQYPMPGSSNEFNLETAMSRLNLSNTLNTGTSNGGFFGPSSSYTLSEDSCSENGDRDRRFSVALQRQLQRERHAAAAATTATATATATTELFPLRNCWNTFLDNPYANAGFQQRLLVSSLDELKGQLYLIAKNENGSSFLEKKLLERNPEDIEIIYWDIRDYFCELMVHQFAHHVVDKLIEVGNPSMLTGIVHSIVSNEHNFIALCNDMHGTHGVQNLLEHLTTREQISMVESAFRRCLLILTKNTNGQHVLKCCVRRFTSEDNKDLLNEIANNCVEIARDKTGCCVLQECVVQAEGAPKKNILESIISNSLLLSKDPYGNFVVQNALEQNIGYVTKEIIKRLSGSLVTLCFDKFGSHVVERCLRKTKNEEIIEHIITEIIHYEDFLSIVQSPYGNYVIQTALTTSKGSLYNSLVNRILNDYAFLHSHPFGKRVLLKARETRSRSFAI